MSRAAKLEFKHDLGRVVKAFETYPKRAGKAAKQSMSLIGLRWEREMRSTRFAPYSPGGGLIDANPGKTLRNRTGRLKSSIQSRVSGDRLHDLTLHLSAGSRSHRSYAALQEYGGTIQAKNKLLTVPTRFAVDPRGLIKPSATLVPGGGMTATGKDTYVVKASNGNLYLYADDGKPGPNPPLYQLRKSVRIPARLGMRSVMKKVVREETGLMLKNIARSVLPTSTLQSMSKGGR